MFRKIDLGYKDRMKTEKQNVNFCYKLNPLQTAI